jgi:ATP-dependent DNA ligase
LVEEKAHFIEPMACLAVAQLPEGVAWEYELKFDGYRALVSRRAASRNSANGRCAAPLRPGKT